MEVHLGNINDQKTGVMSMIYWENPAFEEAMNQLFAVKKNEKIDFVIINYDGIKARFSTKEDPLKSIPDIVNNYNEKSPSLHKNIPPKDEELVNRLLG